jgi:hypothetical protein
MCSKLIQVDLLDKVQVELYQYRTYLTYRDPLTTFVKGVSDLFMLGAAITSL